jgi:hypothetical protein
MDSPISADIALGSPGPQVLSGILHLLQLAPIGR